MGLIQDFADGLDTAFEVVQDFDADPVDWVIDELDHDVQNFFNDPSLETFVGLGPNSNNVYSGIIDAVDFAVDLPGWVGTDGDVNDNTYNPLTGDYANGMNPLPGNWPFGLIPNPNGGSSGKLIIFEI